MINIEMLFSFLVSDSDPSAKMHHNKVFTCLMETVLAAQSSTPAL